jgi:hypothetical protein
MKNCVYNNLNKVGPKTVPCGTPESTDNLEDAMPFKRTCCCLFSKKSLKLNYRPVSLTAICCKLLEHIITSNIRKHLSQNKILHDSQHGFRSKRSCETQLVISIQDLLLSIS